MKSRIEIAREVVCEIRESYRRDAIKARQLVDRCVVDNFDQRVAGVMLIDFLRSQEKRKVHEIEERMRASTSIKELDIFFRIGKLEEEDYEGRPDKCSVKSMALYHRLKRKLANKQGWR